MTVRSRAECTDEQAAAALEMVMGAPPSPSKVCCGCNARQHEP